MIMLDNTVVNVALPSIERSLGIIISQLEWVVTGYALTFGALMLTGGKLADLPGRRRIFVAGSRLHRSPRSRAASPAASAPARCARLQGLGGAMMAPSALSILTVVFPPRPGGTAIGVWAGISALALAIGPLLGGVITEHANWSWILFINVPVAALRWSARCVFSRRVPRHLSRAASGICRGLRARRSASLR